LPAVTRRYQILALSGGGYRGAFSARILEELEAMSARPLRERFDLIAGTSIGALLAAGVTCGVPAAVMSAAFRRHGAAIFDGRLRPFGRRLPFRLPGAGVFWNRYNPTGLRDAVKAVLGDHADLAMADVPHPLIVVATNRQDATAAVFRSKAGSGDRWRRATLLDAVLASAAAPTYFPEHRVLGTSLIDGGIIANAPDMLALAEVMATRGASTADIDIISVGTAGASRRDVPRPARGHGAARWMLPRSLWGRDLFSVTVASQEQSTLETARLLLRERHVRIDTQPTEAETAKLALDRAGRDATGILEALATQAMDDLRRGPSRALVEAMMRHERA